jgi:1,4-alpha-glucan branching enzyme
VDFHYSGFEWLDFADSDHSVISFVRKARHKDGGVVVVGNFTPVPRCGYRIPLPWPGEYRVIYNSDSETYGGSNMGDGSIVVAEEVSYQGRPFSLMLTLPPMAVVYLIKDTSSQI